MKHLFVNYGLLLLCGVMAIYSVGACTASPGVFFDACDSKIPSLTAPQCQDAGTDAETDATPDGMESACFSNGGECLPIPSDDNAYKWQGPAPVWFGPANEKPTECPFDGVIVARKYAGLHAPPLDCASCECEQATGKCAGVPDSISVGTTVCANGGTSVPFDGPGGWDGSCTNANAIAAGAQCPPASGTPCVQSIAWSALPGPQEEACAVKVNPVPKFNGMTTSWDMAAIACDSSLAEDLCGEGKNLCVPKALIPWVQCVWLDGVHENECPDGYASSSIVMYDHEPIDSRACSACSCGEPVGGECVANFSIFKDSACTAEIHKKTISSIMPDCDPIFPAGLAIGSKAITDHLYVPATCAASGGEPIGKAIENEEKATTFCCRLGKIFVD